ncbi:alpha-L-rhamnosidase [Hufsiella ginkgonis]|uniref:alpha-L-rhamnosidase n=1 Tax=Hufsiella ginkgonis TaxID=2695274 RepID=A0A7K1Y3J9_9SPHI|nr:alpha-L-rhamnosidase [Hufsiella ginkgonis]MXV17688.1 family 78 glycoside hydrolase catalytic domain [Hufsiella ginkgonis]
MKKLSFLWLLLLCIIPGLFARQPALRAVYLRTEYKIDPVTDATRPRLSWELRSELRNQWQSAYQVVVASSPALLAPGKADLWDPGMVKTTITNQLEYGGKPLASRQVCYWKVRSWDKNGVAGPWSPIARWEMGLLKGSDWQASWIGNDLDSLGRGKVYHLPPAPYFRKEITLKGTVKRARLYITSLGLYEVRLNGKRVGADYFTPGWTDYHKRVYYQVYDVTAMLAAVSTLSAIVADGWYAGYLGYALLVNNPVKRNFYGRVPLLKAQLEIVYTDGRTSMVGTDGTWKTNYGPVVEADILNGETYNAQLEFPGWDKPGYPAKGWKAAGVYPDLPSRKLEVYPGNPVRILEALRAKKVTARPGGKYIIDLGQNFAGSIRLKVKGRAGDTISLRYGEVLFPEGGLMTGNLRMARAMDTYILKGDPAGETWVPAFTYHGFQYVEVTGLKRTPGLDVITGLVMGSDTPVAGSLVTDNALVNQLYHNIVWTQRSNYFDIPTDCPQRDERLGWTGDAQVYIQSATFNNDIAAFYNKWLVDLNDAQRDDNTYPIYAPAPQVRATDQYSPGWSEAGIICMYHMYKTYGDTKMVRQFWPNMAKYMQFLEDKSKGRYYFPEASFEDISPKGGFGDWLSVGKKTPPDLLATLYFAQCAAMMAEMARGTGLDSEAARYHQVFSLVAARFKEHYTDPAGRFKTNAAAYGDGNGYVDGAMGFDGHTQTAYANAIYTGVLDGAGNEYAGNQLAGLVRENGGKLSTGFLGVKPLLPALSATGHSDVAYRLLLSTEYPSWGFEVINGANTIWERWNSYIKGTGFENNGGMNSFNHYAFGSVNEWLFGNMAGIRLAAPGYRTFVVRPEIAPAEIGKVRASYHSINGEIVSAWQKSGNRLLIEVVIPVNTRATVFIPAPAAENVTESGKPVVNNRDMRVSGIQGQYLVLELGSGKYRFEVR